MSDPFWDPVFALLVEDLECIRLMAENLSDRTLIEPVRGNPLLWKQIQPFTKGDRFLNRPRALEVILRSASEELPLRRILLWSWVQANDHVLRFVTLPADKDSEKRLLQGEFGNLAKLTILARIDPRESAKPLYEKTLSCLREALPAKPVAPAAAETPTRSSNVVGGPMPVADDSSSLKRELEQTRAELRDQRKNLKALEEDRRQWEKRFLDAAQERDALNKKLIDLELTLKKERSRGIEIERSLNASEAEIEALKTAPQAPQQPEEHSVSEVDAGKLSRRILELEIVIERRDRALERQDSDLTALRRELEEVRKSQRIEEKGNGHQNEVFRRLQAWQKARLASLYYRWQEGDRGTPHLVWETLGKGFEIMICSAEECEERTEGELALLVASGDVHDRVHSLEKPLAESVVGVFSLSEEGPVLLGYDGVFPIQAPLPPVVPGDPVAGRLLAGFGDRPEGIRAVRSLKTGPDKTPETFKTFESLASYLQLEKRPRDVMREQLIRLGEPWNIGESGVDFGRDTHLVLPGLRLRLPIVVICDRPECMRAREKHELVRAARPGELCQLCHEEALPVDSTTAATWNFKGARVLLVGGDEVGPAYRTAGEVHQLDVTWLSGFGHLDPNAQGLKDFDLVAVVVRQVSHTLVRELAAAARRQHVRLAFLTRRGVSGVFRELAELLKAAREK